MRRKIIKLIAVVLLIAVSGALYSCQNRPDGGGADIVLEADDTGGVLTDGEVDIKSADNEAGGDSKRGKLSEDNSTDKSIADNKHDSDKESSSDGAVYVYVCGAVKNAGVYPLHSGDRIEAAILAAGGFSEDADTSALNLAELLCDGQKIDVPAVGETIAAGEGTADKGGLLDINRASASELMTLPGIGETKANQIIAYREANGPFESVEALKNVPGIKDGVFEPIKALICAG